ncbi:MAG TPA: hypothetical protein VI341_03590 [Actinomycetota bacterium]
MDATADELAAIEGGRAFARSEGRWILRVTGSDAAAWLHDLVTTDVASLDPGQARRSFLLTPTGRIRADFMVGRDSGGFWLLQSSEQPRAMIDLLSVYVLSSDVSLADMSAGYSVWTLIGGAGERFDGPGLRPSLLGPGCDVLVAHDGADPPWAANDSTAGLAQVDDPALERWRILRGDPRMGIDFPEGALPAEVGLDEAIDTTKGCFLGQESVAKIRNLGHPPSVLRFRRAEGVVAPATPVFDAGTEVGLVTSAATVAGGTTVAIIRVGWASREASLTTPDGLRFEPAHPQD